jgi:cytochrome P450
VHCQPGTTTRRADRALARPVPYRPGAAPGLTRTPPGAVPVLTFAAEPDGGPPPVLRAASGGLLAGRPAGGEPMLVLHDRADVLRVLADPAHFPMAGVTADGELLRCPLTGAEMQSPDGGLLNMDPPRLREYRKRINGLFTRRAAEADRPAIRALAAGLARSLAGALGRGCTAEVITGFAEPFTAAAVCAAMGVPRADWDQVLEFSRVAFAVVPGPAAVPDVAAAWADLYRYYGPIVAAGAARPGRGLTAQLARALEGFTHDQITHVMGTVSNGFGAVLPVLTVALTELAQRPSVVAACLRGERSWGSVTRELLVSRALFPVALPRTVVADCRLGGRPVQAGTVVLPSLYAAALDASGPPPATIPFGAGPHFCPGAALSRVWLATALEEFFSVFPSARLAGPLVWQPGTLSMPRQLVLAVC